ncbi:MAG: response regulator transcription factor [Bacteroidetes bacterium]|nr:response regulator transcription factor [Bacteroidota bacterium]
MLRSVVIDDIASIRANNIELIKTYCPFITVLAEADGVETGIQIIKQYAPDLVFLDVDMNDGTGFDLLERLKPIKFKVIFITGYENYASKAFRFSALDFLLKPINPTELVEAANKAITNLDKEILELKFNTLFSNLERPKNLQKIILKTAEKVFSISIQDIVRCESDKNYTTFYLLDGQKLLISNTLKEYDIMLEPMGFFRCHQSHLINMAYFDHYLKTDGGAVVMKDKSLVALSPRKREKLFLLLENI